jgi:ribosomal-protein-alanine N-acetyltransferase
MNLSMVALTSAHTDVAAALHELSGLHQPWSAEAFLNLLSLSGVAGLLALIEEDPAGLILWRTVADEAEILTLCVHPQARKRGVGRALVEFAKGSVRKGGAQRLVLEVAVDNEPAKALYLQEGFRSEGRRNRYYQTKAGETDALILATDL